MGVCYYKSVVLPIVTFFMVLTTTILLAMSLRKNKTWNDANNSQPGNSMATHENKEMRAMKMVMTIATVSIIAAIPFSAHILTCSYTCTRASLSLAAIGVCKGELACFSVMIVCVNCGVNAIIYYNMSSNFRHAMQVLFREKRLIVGHLLQHE